MDDRIDRLIELRTIRDDAAAEIEAILNGGGIKERKSRAPQKCSICGAAGHTARSCDKNTAGTSLADER
jgi:hypothetical protein